jgi:hypothetical protein
MHAKHADNSQPNERPGRMINCAFTAINTLGAGFPEKVYENSLAYEVRAAGLLRKSRRSDVRPTVMAGHVPATSRDRFSLRMAGTCLDMPGHDGGTTCRWHFHPIVVPAGGLGDCAKIPSSPAAPPGWQCGPRLFVTAGRPKSRPYDARPVKITLPAPKEIVDEDHNHPG